MLTVGPEQWGKESRRTKLLHGAAAQLGHRRVEFTAQDLNGDFWAAIGSKRTRAIKKGTPKQHKVGAGS